MLNVDFFNGFLITKLASFNSNTRARIQKSTREIGMLPHLITEQWLLDLIDRFFSFDSYSETHKSLQSRMQNWLADKECLQWKSWWQILTFIIRTHFNLYLLFPSDFYILSINFEQKKIHSLIDLKKSQLDKTGQHSVFMRYYTKKNTYWLAETFWVN